MPAPRLPRCARWLRLALGLLGGASLAFAAKPITPHGPHGSTILTAPALPLTALGSDDDPGLAAQFQTQPMALPPNIASVTFEASGTSEFGDLIRLSGAAHFIGSVSVSMSSGALRSDYPGSTQFGFMHPVTLSLYAVDRTGSAPRAGSVLARVTESFLIPWRPEPSAAGAALPGRPWRTEDGHFYTGKAFTLTFDVGALGLALPDEVIVGISFNTQHHGQQPLGTPGPYDSIGLGLSDLPSTSGFDVEPDAVFWKSTEAPNQLRRDQGWAPFKPAIRVNDSNYGVLYETIRLLDDLRTSNPELRAALNSARALTADALDRQFWDGNQRLNAAFGEFVFEALAEASDALSLLVARRDPHALIAQQAIDGLLASTVNLAENAIADALIVGGNTRRIIRAQNAIDRADQSEARSAFGEAIDHHGAAWREALGSMQ